MAKDSVKVKIKYLAALRDRVGVKQEEIELSQGATLRDVAVWLKERYDLSLPSLQIMATLNGRGWGQFPQKMETVLSEGDEICLFPPISGGRCRYLTLWS